MNSSDDFKIEAKRTKDGDIYFENKSGNVLLSPPLLAETKEKIPFYYKLNITQNLSGYFNRHDVIVLQELLHHIELCYKHMIGEYCYKSFDELWEKYFICFGYGEKENETE